MASFKQSAWSYPYHKYSQIYLENTTNGHNKFYEMTNPGGKTWTARWGIIGTNGQKIEYTDTLWETKLAEKLAKGYIIENVIDIHSGVATEVINEPEPPLYDEEVLRKINRIIVFLNSKKNITAVETVFKISANYVDTGILTKSDMEMLNDLWVTNGGGKW